MKQYVKPEVEIIGFGNVDIFMSGIDVAPTPTTEATPTPISTPTPEITPKPEATSSGNPLKDEGSAGPGESAFATGADAETPLEDTPGQDNSGQNNSGQDNLEQNNLGENTSEDLTASTYIEESNTYDTVQESTPVVDDVLE